VAFEVTWRASVLIGAVTAVMALMVHRNGAGRVLEGRWLVRPDDVERFYSHVLKGPEVDSCWLWLGAISDDGCGRFWIGTAGGQRAVAAHRFALATVHGRLAAIGTDARIGDT
jgi:hypothetical protein